MIDPKPRDINPIHLIILHKSLVNSGGKNPSVLGTKPPVIGETPPHTRSKSPTWNAKPPFLGWFPLHKTRWNYHFTSCGHPCEAAKFALNGYFSPWNWPYFEAKCKHLPLLYCKEVQITSWTGTTLISKASTKCHTFDVARLCPR